MSKAAKIHLYAEHLLNIRALTLTATLSSDSTPLTHAKLSADASSLTFSHEDVSATIRLPTAIEGGGDAVLDLPKQQATELQLRLKLEEKESGNSFIKDPGIHGVGQDDNWVPWSASALNDFQGAFACKSCDQSFLHVGTDTSLPDKANPDRPRCIHLWKDLPNENWAEMMDFWHCHKPHDEDTTQQQNGLQQKGYAADNKLRAVAGTCYVDLGSFLVSHINCENIKMSTNTSMTGSLSCARCETEIGKTDEKAEGWRIWKWSLKAVSGSAKGRNFDEPGRPAQWISAQLLALTENQGVRKFIVRNATGNEGKDSFFLWVFTPDLRYSSSYQTPGETRNDPTRAMKVFWKRDSSMHSESVKGESLIMEEVELPAALFAELQETLSISKSLLPTNAQKFQDWNIALFDRFSGSELGGPQ